MQNSLSSSPCSWKLLDVLVIMGFIAGFGWLYHQAGRLLFGWIVKTITFIPANELYYFLFGAVLQTTAIIGLVYYFCFIKYRGETEDLGLGRYPWQRALMQGFFGGILLFTLVIVGAALISIVYPKAPSPQPFAELVMQARNWQEIVLTFLIGSVLAPISEEMYFRGFAYSYFRTKFGAGVALWISACFFAMMHLDLLRFIPLMLGGLGLAWLYERTGSLYPSIIAHGVWNGVMTLILFLGVAS